MNFGMGGLFANYKEKNAIRLASSQGASLTFLFTLLYLVLLIIILFIPVSGYFYSLERGVNYSLINLLSTTIVLLILAISISAVSLKVGFKSFNSDI
jgi:cytochrome b561